MMRYFLRSINVFVNVMMLTSEGVFAYDKNFLPPKEKE